MSPRIAETRFRSRSEFSSVAKRLVEALDGVLRLTPSDQDLRVRPLRLEFLPPLPSRARFYAYQATSHLSERDKDAWKIQATVGTRGSGTRNRFDWSDGHMVYLLGWVPNYGVWIVYNAKVQEGDSGIPYSKSCYVDRAAVTSAAVTGLVETTTVLRRPTREEKILVCTNSRLQEALLRRFRTHLDLGS